MEPMDAIINTTKENLKVLVEGERIDSMYPSRIKDHISITDRSVNKAVLVFLVNLIKSKHNKKNKIPSFKTGKVVNDYQITFENRNFELPSDHRN